MTIQLYMNHLGAPSRCVQMTAKALGINLELKSVDLKNGEQKTPEFIKLNPQHTIPLINDGGIILWESHAIIAYLASKYAKNESLYPKDPVKRASVDQRLHFDTGVLSARAKQAVEPIYMGKKKTVEQAQIDSITEAYDFLEKFLESRKWIAGDSVTIADYSIYNTLSTANLLVPVDSSKFPKLSAWHKKVDTLPESEVAKEGLKMVADFLNKMLEK